MNNLLRLFLIVLFTLSTPIIASVSENTLLQSFVMCSLYVLIYILFGNKTNKAFNKRTGALMLLSFLAVNFTLSFILSRFFEPEIRSFTFLEALVSVVLFPVSEELLFRATLYNSFKKSVPVWVAALFSALVFALLHGEAASMIVAFAAGIMLSLIYDRTGSITLPIICHISNNLLAVLFEV